jgi:hypothetical protein
VVRVSGNVTQDIIEFGFRGGEKNPPTLKRRASQQNGGFNGSPFAFAEQGILLLGEPEPDGDVALFGLRGAQVPRALLPARDDGNRQCAECGHTFAARQEWAIYFLMAVGFWNFVGAGVFGFLINLPIVSYFEVGTLLTSNHGHAAMFGVFGMLALAVVIFCLRALLDDARWRRIEPLVRTGFWGLNIGLALMVLLDLFPGGVLQLWDSLTNGYWHARRLTYLLSGTFHALEWARIVADTVFLLFGVVPLVVATLRSIRWPSSPALPSVTLPRAKRGLR